MGLLFETGVPYVLAALSCLQARYCLLLCMSMMQILVTLHAAFHLLVCMVVSRM